MSRRIGMAEGDRPVSALDLALRAARSGQTTCVIQLCPGKEPYEELVVPDNLFAKLLVFPAIRDARNGNEGNAGASRGLELARLAMVCGRYDLVIVDEAPAVLARGDIREEEIRRLGSMEAKTRLIVIGLGEATGKRRPFFGKTGNGNRNTHQHGRNNIVREEI